MGYGKTTAVNWYLLERAKLDEAAVVRISVYSDNLAIFWKSVQEAFSHAGFDFLRAYPCPDDAAGGSLLTDDLCHALAGKRPCYIFIDDFHLLTDNRVPAFLCTLTNRLPENVHLIVASRDRSTPWVPSSCASTTRSSRSTPTAAARSSRTRRSNRCSIRARGGSRPFT